MQFLAEKKYSEAYINLLKAIKKIPNQPKIYNNMGVVLSGMHRYKEAIKYYESAIQLDHNYFNAYYNLTIALYQLKDYKTAIRIANSALNLGDENSGKIDRIISLKGSILIDSGDKEKAKEIYIDFLQHNDNHLIRLRLAQIYLSEKKYPAVAETLTNKGKIPIDKIESKEVLKILMLAYQNLSEFRYLKQALARYVSQTKDLKFVQEKAAKLLNEKKYQHAIPWMEVIYDNNPEDLEWGMKLAKFCHQSGHTEKAFTIAFKIFQEHLNQDHIQDAMTTADLLWEWNPDFIDARLELIEYFKSHQDWKSAEDQFEYIFSKKKDQVKLLKDFMEVLQELAKRDSKYMVKIANVWQDIATLQPDDPNVYLELGKINAVKLNYQDAIHYFELVVAMNPEIDEAYYQLGLLNLAIDKPQKAIKYLEKIAGKKEQFPNINQIIKEVRAINRGDEY